MKHVYVADDCALWWIAADDAEDALNCLVETVEATPEYVERVEQLPDDEPLTVRESSNDGQDETRTCAEWAALYDHPEVFAGTEC